MLSVFIINSEISFAPVFPKLFSERSRTSKALFPFRYLERKPTSFTFLYFKFSNLVPFGEFKEFSDEIYMISLICLFL